MSKATSVGGYTMSLAGGKFQYNEVERKLDRKKKRKKKK